MHSAGVPADTVSYNTVINAWAQAADPEKSEEWLFKTRSAGVSANVVSYSTVIAASGCYCEGWIELLVTRGTAPSIAALEHSWDGAVYGQFLLQWAPH